MGGWCVARGKFTWNLHPGCLTPVVTERIVWRSLLLKNMFEPRHLLKRVKIPGSFSKKGHFWTFFFFVNNMFIYLKLMEVWSNGMRFQGSVGLGTNKIAGSIRRCRMLEACNCVQIISNHPIFFWKNCIKTITVPTCIMILPRYYNPSINQITSNPNLTPVVNGSN